VVFSLYSLVTYLLICEECFLYRADGGVLSSALLFSIFIIFIF